MDKEFVLNQNLVNAICPRPIGWLEYTLSQTEIDYLWKCVENKGDTVPIFNKLYNIDTFNLEDNNNWFFNNSLLPLLNRYIDEFKNMGEEVNIDYLFSEITGGVEMGSAQEFDLNFMKSSIKS